MMEALIQDVLQDVRFALRILRGRPGFAALAVLTLGLGIGGTTAVYSVVHAVLLRPLPYKNPDELVVIWDNSVRDRNLKAQRLPGYADFEEYDLHARSIEKIAAVGRTRPVLHHGGASTRRLAGLATLATFNRTLGVEPALGRVFIDEDQRGGCVVVLQHHFWATTLGADASWIGKSLTLDQSSCTVLGVLPAGFTFFPVDAEIWFLMGHDSTPAKKSLNVAMFARLKTGVTMEQARAELTALHSALHQNDPPEGNGERDSEPDIDGLQREFTYLASAELRTSLLIVFAAVSLVLVIACMNVANLLMARLADRQRELVVRAALGSGRMRLVRQVLTESLLLSVMGTALGIGIASASVRHFRMHSPIGLPPHAGVIGVDFQVLLFAALLAVTTTLLFGLIPAVQVSRVDLSQSLKSAGRGFFGTSSRRYTAQTVLAVEMAVSFVLLAGAGLLTTSALRMGSESLGFDSEGIFRFRLTLPTPRFGDAGRRTRFYDELLTRLEDLPGVAMVAFGQFPPFSAGGDDRLEIQGREASGTPVVDVDDLVVSPRYFELLRTPLLRGRGFGAQDRPESPQVAIVSQALVDEYFPNLDPLGQQIRVINGDDRSSWMTIIGVVGTQKHMVNDSSWRDTPVVYRAFAQQPYPQISVGLRASGSLALLGRELQTQVSALDSSVQLDEGELLALRLESMLAYPRFRAALLACFAMGALLLVVVGLHGVLAQLVAQRTPEFGVRRAVGAQTSDLLWLVARQGGIPVLVGLAAGLACSLVFSRLLTSFLYKIRPADPGMLAAVSIVLLTVAGLAMALPARRAALVDPMVALRDE